MAAKAKPKTNRRGRKCKYHEYVEPFLADVRKWAMQGASEEEIARKLGIAYSTFKVYKNDFSALAAEIKEGRKGAVTEIKAALFKKACGYEYVESKEVFDETGAMVRKELYHKHAAPDAACSMILLKHWAKDEGWTNDPASLELKRQELELRREQMSEDW